MEPRVFKLSEALNDVSADLCIHAAEKTKVVLRDVLQLCSSREEQILVCECIIVLMLGAVTEYSLGGPESNTKRTREEIVKRSLNSAGRMFHDMYERVNKK